MGSVNEELQGLNVRVFKWNELLHNVTSSEGLFLFRTYDTTNSDVQQQPLKKFHVVVFKLTCLSDRDSVNELVSEAIKCRECCTNDTIECLRKTTSEYLLTRFQFDIQTLSFLKKSTVVIVVDVGVSTTRMNSMDSPTSDGKRRLSSTFSSERQETEYSKDDVSTGSEFAKKRKVGNARDYNKQIRSRLQRMKSLDQEEFDIRTILRICLDEPFTFWITPIVAGERKGLSQVQVAMKEMKFDSLESVDACPICLDGICKGMVVAKTPCSHMFHKDCLLQWLLKDTRCPLCRSSCATLV